MQVNVHDSSLTFPKTAGMQQILNIKWLIDAKIVNVSHILIWYHIGNEMHFPNKNISPSLHIYFWGPACIHFCFIWPLVFVILIMCGWIYLGLVVALHNYHGVINDICVSFTCNTTQYITTKRRQIAHCRFTYLKLQNSTGVLMVASVLFINDH